MRIIKFRAWDIEEKVMIRSNHAVDFSGEVVYYKMGCVLPAKNIELMQFTGLKDKNGMEIYENDFVTSKSHLPEVMQVEFIEGAFCMTHPTINDYPIDINHFYPSIGTDLVVIGNIYENAELIK